MSLKCQGSFVTIQGNNEGLRNWQVKGEDLPWRTAAAHMKNMRGPGSHHISDMTLISDMTTTINRNGGKEGNRGSS